MPYRSEKMKLPPEFDRRRKLSDEQKDEIRHNYNTGVYSLNGLAKEYSVSKKTILLIVNPESKRKNDQRIKDHWKDYSPGREERNAITRERRSVTVGSNPTVPSQKRKSLVCICTTSLSLPS